MTTEQKLLIIGFLFLGGIVTIAIWSRGTSNKLNDNLTYGKLIGNKYETKTDLFLTQSQTSGKYFVKVPGKLVPGIDEIKKFPRVGNETIIHKIIFKKSIFTITDVIETNKPLRGSDVWIKAKFEDESIFKEPIDVSFIANSNAGYTEMDTRYVTEVPSEGKTDEKE